MKPVASHYPDTLETIGDHIKTRRLDLGLYQKDLARRLGISKDTVAYLENNRNQPSLRMVPRITAFLGYNPLLEAQPNETFGEQILRVRRALGIRQKDMAREIGVDPTTLGRWERGEREPAPEYRKLLNDILMSAGPKPGRGEAAGDHETTS
jgi:transcriptional regulator with XRE-family HTH domain